MASRPRRGGVAEGCLAAVRGRLRTAAPGEAAPGEAAPGEAARRISGEAASPNTARGVAEDLRELATGDAEDHQNFWVELARELTAHEDGTSHWLLELLALSSSSFNDALGRYFDATSSGLEYIYRKHAPHAPQDGAPGMDRQGLCTALVEHFGFSGAKVNPETTMKDVLDKAEGPDGFISSGSFAEVVRKLRIGALLARNFVPELSTTSVYNSVHCDKDWSLKLMSFDDGEGPLQDDEHLDDVMAICHTTLGQAEVDHVESIEKFLFHNPHGRGTGKVHWLHVHRPDTRLVLALGQRFHLRLSVIGMLCRINDVPPQIDDLGKKASLGTSSWSSVVFPCAFLDKRSRRCLERHRVWRSRMEGLATQTPAHLRKRDRKKSHAGDSLVGLADDEPSIFVGVIQVTQILLWNGTTEEGEDIVTSLGTPKYLGYWMATLPKKGGFWSSLVGLLPCTKRNRLDGYTPLPQDDKIDEPDEEMGESRLSFQSTANLGTGSWNTTSFPSMSHSLSREDADDMNHQSADDRGLMRYHNEADHYTRYRSFYRGIHQQLQDKNSVLRMGNAFHLLVRIILDGTTEYMNVLELYEIAIAKCKTKLAEHNSREGPDQMTMVSLAKMELKTILVSLKNFEEAVLPELRILCSHPGGTEHRISLSERVIRHHMIDIDHNVAQVVRQCECQIHICENLIDEYDRKAMDKANNILNFLTFITFLMVPLQILTGYYGMNFTHGLYGVRERDGEMYFWAFGLAGTLLMACIMLYLNRTYS